MQILETSAPSDLTFEPEEHRYFSGGKEMPSVTTVLEEVGLIDKRWYAEYYAEFGTAVHVATQYDDEGDLDEDDLDPDIVPFVEGWREFRRVSGFEVTAVEVMVACPIHWYAGILDRVGTMNGRPCLVDIKTGGVPKWAGLQTAAYERCLKGAYDRYVVQLPRKGGYKLTPFRDPTDREYFLAARAVISWKHANL